MAVKVTETKVSLRTIVTRTNSDGNIKKRSININNIDNSVTNDKLYDLSVGVANLVDGNFASALKGKDETLANE